MSPDGWDAYHEAEDRRLGIVRKETTLSPKALITSKQAAQEALEIMRLLIHVDAKGG